MPRTPELRLCDALEGALVALPLVVSEVSCDIVDVAVPSYPDGTRPSATVVLAGEGCHGCGEHVLWSRREHECFGAHACAETPRGAWQLGEWVRELARRTPSAHGRAALEAAGIDLALRQAGTNLFRLAARPPLPIRYVISFDRRADPAGEIRRQRERNPGLCFKVDVDPQWTAPVYDELAASGAVAILDFKGGGSRDDHQRAHESLPEAWIEDPDPAAAPWPSRVAARLTFDAPLTSADALNALPVRPAAINVKPARLGGVLEALRLVGECARRELPVYFGGMFEVSVGRRQLWELAALLAAEAPNDVAPIAAGATALATAALPPLPARLVIDHATAGFGAPMPRDTGADSAR